MAVLPGPPPMAFLAPWTPSTLPGVPAAASLVSTTGSGGWAGAAAGSAAEEPGA
eukprot:CAMPEP_0203920492 /NCGR_PEP_ID=MMETSP0359-20131031/60783_1 /ASSEMBLY_ACC=CAM_ASM_000338 /TAXON_ID=268821 /ORGANISM="Scrippsiella Hangoei, Strain SHTV-5" /LENGTH=53 /DNA_ID=CAMNT_0050848005 /DNA_START=56 /DNA_END=213 /DNA_ORIENTATION=+